MNLAPIGTIVELEYAIWQVKSGGLWQVKSAIIMFLQ